MDDLCHCINVDNDWIYYSNYSDNGKIYRADTYGGQREKLCDIENARKINLSKNKVFFYTNEYKLFYLNKKGNEIQLIT